MPPLHRTMPKCLRKTTALSLSSPLSKTLFPNVHSIGFSGAGFMVCYHMGAAKCLLDQGILPDYSGKRTTTLSSVQPMDPSAPYPIALTGVSAGALTAAALVAGVDPEDGMDALFKITDTIRVGGNRYLDVLHPGISLVDSVEKHFHRMLREAVDRTCSSPTEFLQRIDYGKRLRLGLTDKRIFPPVGQNPRAMLYVDRYRDVDDVLAVCVLSSYVPGMTGPAQGSLSRQHGAVKRAMERVREMIALGAVKKGLTHEPLSPASAWADQREICWDGGLVNAFPVIDDQTIIITPIATSFTRNKTINPSIGYTNQQRYRTLCVPLNSNVQFHVTPSNMLTLRQIAFTSDRKILEERYAQGYDNAHQYLRQHNLVSVHHQHKGIQWPLEPARGTTDQQAILEIPDTNKDPSRRGLGGPEMFA